MSAETWVRDDGLEPPEFTFDPYATVSAECIPIHVANLRMLLRLAGFRRQGSTRDRKRYTTELVSGDTITQGVVGGMPAIRVSAGEKQDETMLVFPREPAARGPLLIALAVAVRGVLAETPGWVWNPVGDPVADDVLEEERERILDAIQNPAPLLKALIGINETAKLILEWVAGVVRDEVDG